MPRCAAYICFVDDAKPVGGSHGGCGYLEDRSCGREFLSIAAHNGMNIMAIIDDNSLKWGKVSDDSQSLENVPLSLKREVYPKAMDIAEKISVCLPEMIDDGSSYGKDTWKPHNDRYSCSLPVSFASVSRDGNIYSCCKMAKRYPLGNVLTDSFESVWNGPGYKALLKSEPQWQTSEVLRGLHSDKGIRLVMQSA